MKNIRQSLYSKELNIAIISIGDELLKGKTLNKNLLLIGKELFSIGIYPKFQLTVRDDKEDILTALDFCYDRCDVLIITGGLGPTTDDITLETVANFLNLNIVYSDEAYKNLSKFLIKKDREWGIKDNIKQAYTPEGSKIIKNINGTASGIEIEKNGKNLFILPGPPIEMAPMLRNRVIPAIRERMPYRLYKRIITFLDIPEASLQQRIKEVLKERYNLATISFRSSPGICEVMVMDIDRSLVEKISEAIINNIQVDILSEGYTSPIEEVVNILNKNKITISTAESCTGGLIASSMVSIPGVSSIFLGGCIAYDNKIKVNILDVDEDTIKKFGAVSKECAVKMAKGASNRFGSDVTIAVTGIAGPEGGSKEKPVGLIYIAIKLFSKLSVYKFLFLGDRETIRQQTLNMAIIKLRKELINEIKNYKKEKSK